MWIPMSAIIGGLLIVAICNLDSKTLVELVQIIVGIGVLAGVIFYMVVIKPNAWEKEVRADVKESISKEVKEELAPWELNWAKQ